MSAAGPDLRADCAPVALLRARGLCFDAGGKRLVDRVDAEFRPHRSTVIMGATAPARAYSCGCCMA